MKDKIWMILALIGIIDFTLQMSTDGEFKLIRTVLTILFNIFKH